MSKLFENKQIIHIASEFVVLTGLTFYFSSKNKKLLEHIEDLSQRLEEQEDIIQKHDNSIKELINAVNNIRQPYRNQPPHPPNRHKVHSTHPPPPPPSPSPKIQHSRKYEKSTKSRKKSPATVKKEKVREDDEILYEKISEEESQTEGDSELDADILDELKELVDDNDNLKKKL
jgi:hypothetical protein